MQVNIKRLEKLSNTYSMSMQGKSINLFSLITEFLFNLNCLHKLMHFADYKLMN